MKKILMLGASHFQVPAIKYAKEAGYYVITADYKPDNPGHKFSDEYHDVSTIKKDEILKLSSELNIDGILSYASDPGAPTAAYVSEKLGLPGNPYKSVLTLQRKDLFRRFLKQHNFNVPESDSFKGLTNAKEYAAYLLDNFENIIVKPVDSSGSKGVSKLSAIDKFDAFFEKAKDFSLSDQVVIEQFIEKRSYQMDGDGFVWDGHLSFSCFGTQHNDYECHSHVPVGISFPYVESEEIQKRARKQIDRIMSLLDMKVGGLNIEFIIDQADNIYIIEIGPRSGGNLIPEVVKYATGVDLIKYSVEGALGKDCSDLKQVDTKGFYSSYILHARKTGTAEKIVIDDEIVPHIVEQNIMVEKGDKVQKFDGSHNTLGTFILKFKDHQEMINKLDEMHKYITVKTY
ncbi:acetyl-CoA carboxylase biotin carboxylase subunit family protein [Halalkalibaculum sp. DA3122]|uniref:ATP-grasp domain-containing protein n=1 Tax=Halalkalibaculum sp. DA3122 TaxID=3373607 RepID=UPI00375461AC